MKASAYRVSSIIILEFKDVDEHCLSCQIPYFASSWQGYVLGRLSKRQRERWNIWHCEGVLQGGTTAQCTTGGRRSEFVARQLYIISLVHGGSCHKHGNDRSFWYTRPPGKMFFSKNLVLVYDFAEDFPSFFEVHGARLAVRHFPPIPFGNLFNQLPRCIDKVPRYKVRLTLTPK